MVLGALPLNFGKSSSDHCNWCTCFTYAGLPIDWTSLQPHVDGGGATMDAVSRKDPLDVGAYRLARNA